MEKTKQNEGKGGRPGTDQKFPACRFRRRPAFPRSHRKISINGYKRTKSYLEISIHYYIIVKKGERSAEYGYF